VNSTFPRLFLAIRQIVEVGGRRTDKIAGAMWCPRCKSSRIQRGYDDSAIVLRMAGLHELLCNNCGLEFKGFDPLRRLKRTPVMRTGSGTNQRRFPRYKVHLPTTICLVERDPLTWDVAYTQRSRGHCETISQIGMALSFVGSRFAEKELTRPGCSLFVTLTLPDGAISAVVSIVYWNRLGSKGKSGWLVGTTISQTSDADAARLAAHIRKRAQTEPYLALD
jgi:predicted Zn-ribbon and HTH transcriptional regulator